MTACEPTTIWHLLTSSRFTGAAEPALTLCRDLGRGGRTVRLFVDRKRPGDLAARTPEFGADLLGDGLVLSVKSSPLQMLRDLRRLRAWFGGADAPQVVHCHASHDHVLCRLALRGRSRPVLVRHLHGGRSAMAGRVRRWLWRGTSGAVVASSAQAAELVLAHGFPREQILVLANTVDTRRFQPDGPGREAVRREIGLPADAQLVGLVARFRPGRGHDRLVDAFRLLGERQPTAHLALIGRGEEREAVGAQVHRGGLADRVHFLGYRDRDLPEVYRALDLAVLLREGSDAGCRAVLEAMAVGLPLLGTRRAAIPELVVDGETGRLVDDDEPGGLAAALDNLLSDPAALRRMGQGGRSRVLAEFGGEARADRCAEFYRLLLRPTGAARQP